MDERLQGRLDRLHPSVKSHIELKDREIAGLQSAIAQLRGQIEPDPLAPRIADFMTELEDQQLPCRRVRFGEGRSGFTVELQESRPERLVVRGERGLCFRTNSSNEVIIDQKGWD